MFSIRKIIFVPESESIPEEVLRGLDIYRNSRNSILNQCEIVVFPGGVEALKKLVSDFRGVFCVITDDSSMKAEFNNSAIPWSKRYIDGLVNEVDWILGNYSAEYRNMDDNHTFFISDNHFYHTNIIKYCNRPWNSGKDEAGNIVVTDKNVTEMNNEMIARWNLVVGKNDTVWNLGDFAFGKKEHIPELLSRLNGKINLVLGNHDHHKFSFYREAGFNKIYDRPVILGGFIVLSHAPMPWIKAPMFNIFGHVHDQKLYKDFTESTFCCCVERIQYTPISLKEIADTVELKYPGRTDGQPEEA